MNFLELSELLNTNIRVAELQKPLKYMKVHIDPERLPGLLTGKIRTTLPEDCTVYGLGVSEDFFGMYLILRSEEWEEIPPGNMIPTLNLVWYIVEEEVPV